MHLMVDTDAVHRLGVAFDAATDRLAAPHRQAQQVAVPPSGHEWFPSAAAEVDAVRRALTFLVTELADTATAVSGRLRLAAERYRDADQPL